MKITRILALVTLILTAFGSGAPDRAATSATTPVATGVAPEPEVLATVGNLQLRLPIAAEAVTAIGFHGADGGAMELDPIGRQANEGLLARLPTHRPLSVPATQRGLDGRLSIHGDGVRRLAAAPLDAPTSHARRNRRK